MSARSLLIVTSDRSFLSAPTCPVCSAAVAVVAGAGLVVVEVSLLPMLVEEEEVILPAEGIEGVTEDVLEAMRPTKITKEFVDHGVGLRLQAWHICLSFQTTLYSMQDLKGTLFFIG